MSEGLADLLSDWTLDLRPVGGKLGLALVRQDRAESQSDRGTASAAVDA